MITNWLFLDRGTRSFGTLSPGIGRLDRLKKYSHTLWIFPLLFYFGGAAAQPRGRIIGYARLPADTFRDGPPATNSPAGLFKKAPPRWDRQPVQGISSLQHAGDGTYWALADNGFGSRRNSGSFILVLYRFSIDWRTPESGDGAVQLLEAVELRDPHHHAGKIHRRHDPLRRLTGADFDPESLWPSVDGGFWIGDEFGPWLLHFSADGLLQEPPIPATILRHEKRLVVRSPDRPGWGRANLPRSRGFEGLAYHPGMGGLFLLLEGTLKNEAPGQLRLFNYIPGLSKTAEATPWRYPLERPGHAIGELSYWPERRLFLVLERDWGHGPQARFKRVFAWQPEGGLAVKEELLDLMSLADPDHLASERDIFDLPYVTLESVLPVDATRLIVCNDNNYPAVGGRSSDRRDDTEFVLVQLENMERPR